MTEFSLAFDAVRSTRIVSPEGVRPGLVRITDGRISGVYPYDSTTAGLHVRDVGSDAVLPGLLDCHVHFNEPGRTEWEGFETGARAAAAGGFTTIVEMPLNSIPSTTSVEALKLKRHSARGRCMIDYAFWGGVVNGDAAAVEALADAGVPGFKCFLIHPGTDEFRMVTEEQLRSVMPVIAARGLPLLVHAELAGPMEGAVDDHADWRSYETYLRSRPPAAEVQAIRMMIKLSHEFRCRVHIVHLSAAEALAELRQARADGVPVTVETCPHYLCFESETIADGATEFKCAPPIRGAANRKALWRGLRDGVINSIASDHSPCPPHLKTAAGRAFWARVGRHQFSFAFSSGGLERGANAWIHAGRYGAMAVGRARETSGIRRSQRSDPGGIRCGPRHFRYRGRMDGDGEGSLFSPRRLALFGRAIFWQGESNFPARSGLF